MTELSPKRMVGFMIGIWYLATAIAYSLAGFAAKLTASPKELISPLLTSHLYSHVFGMLGWSTIFFGLVILALVPYFKRIIAEEPMDNATCKIQDNSILLS